MLNMKYTTSRRRQAGGYRIWDMEYGMWDVGYRI